MALGNSLLQSIQSRPIVPMMPLNPLQTNLQHPSLQKGLVRQTFKVTSLNIPNCPNLLSRGSVIGFRRSQVNINTKNKHWPILLLGITGYSPVGLVEFKSRQKCQKVNTSSLPKSWHRIRHGIHKNMKHKYSGISHVCKKESIKVKSSIKNS